MDPYLLQVEVASINYDLMTLDDMLHDGSSFVMPVTSLIARLPSKFMLTARSPSCNSSFFTFTGNFQAHRLIF